MTNTIVRGVSEEFEAFFYEEDNATPQFVVGGVSYNIIAFNNMSIAAGIAEQDPINLARWKLNVTIPLTAPVTNGSDYYTLIWRAKTLKGNINTQRDRFFVEDSANDGSHLEDNTKVVMAGQSFTLSLLADTDQITALSLRILREGNDTPVITLNNVIDLIGQGIAAKPRASGTKFSYDVQIAGGLLSAISSQSLQGGMATYFAYYNYLDKFGREETVINPIYVVNSTIIGMMNAMNQFVNVLHNQDVVTSLQISEAKLVHFAYQGLLKLNATSPINFSFDFNSLSHNQGFYMWAIKCAELELLKALYMGEGMSAFNFSGMTVQLDSDRTQYLGQMISELQNEIDSQLPKVKSQYARGGGASGRMGTIGLHIGPASNFSYRGGFGKGLGGINMGNISGLPFL
jgi:hypothetical protein